MEVQAVPTLVQQFRETMEGTQGTSWILDPGPQHSYFGIIESLPAEQAFDIPVAGHKSIAAHTAHMLFALDLFHHRMQGEDPKADWSKSFELSDRTPAGWETLKKSLRQTYDAVMVVVNKQATVPLSEWPDIYIVGLCAMTAHNAYHLGSIRQIQIAVTDA